MLKDVKSHFLGKNGNIKRTCIFDHIMGEIIFIDSYGNAVRRRGDLLYGVDDTSVILFAVFCRQNKKAVAQAQTLLLDS